MKGRPLASTRLAGSVEVGKGVEVKAEGKVEKA